MPGIDRAPVEVPTQRTSVGSDERLLQRDRLVGPAHQAVFHARQIDDHIGVAQQTLVAILRQEAGQMRRALADPSGAVDPPVVAGDVERRSTVPSRRAASIILENGLVRRIGADEDDLGARRIAVIPLDAAPCPGTLSGRTNARPPERSTMLFSASLVTRLTSAAALDVPQRGAVRRERSS